MRCARQSGLRGGGGGRAARPQQAAGGDGGGAHPPVRARHSGLGAPRGEGHPQVGSRLQRGPPAHRKRRQRLDQHLGRRRGGAGALPPEASPPARRSPTLAVAMRATPLASRAPRSTLGPWVSSESGRPRLTMGVVDSRSGLSQRAVDAGCGAPAVQRTRLCGRNEGLGGLGRRRAAWRGRGGWLGETRYFVWCPAGAVGRIREGNVAGGLLGRRAHVRRQWPPHLRRQRRCGAPASSALNCRRNHHFRHSCRLWRDPASERKERHARTLAAPPALCRRVVPRCAVLPV